MKQIGQIIPIRYVVIGTAFLGFMFNYGLRVNMSIAIVAMVNHTAVGALRHQQQLASGEPTTSAASVRESECMTRHQQPTHNASSSSSLLEMTNGEPTSATKQEDSASSVAGGGTPRIARTALLASDDPGRVTTTSEYESTATVTAATPSSPTQHQVDSSTSSAILTSEPENGRNAGNRSGSSQGAKNKQDGSLVWDEGVQGLVLSSFYWGYIVTQMPGGRLAELFGPKHVLAVSLMGTALVTLFVPLAARAHHGLVIALRVLIGLLEGASYPAITVLLARWAPECERSRMTAIVFVGSMFGTFVILPIAGLLIDLYGWESVFYFSGASTIVWGVLWMAVVHDDPRRHPWVSKEELRTILGSKYVQLPVADAEEASGGGRNAVAEASIIELPRRPKTIPWRDMARSKPLWALTVASAGHGYGFTVILSLMPTYLKTMQGFDIKSNGTLSALPYLGRTIMGLLFSVFIDWLLRKAWFSRTTLRKFAVSVAYLTAGSALLLTSFSGCHAELTVVLLILTVTAVGADYSGTAPTYLDLCSNYTGCAMGFANAAFTVTAIIAPIASGYILKGQQNLATWGTIFRIAGAIYILGDVVFLAWGSAEEQPWNNHGFHHNSADADGTDMTMTTTTTTTTTTTVTQHGGDGGADGQPLAARHELPDVDELANAVVFNMGAEDDGDEEESDGGVSSESSTSSLQRSSSSSEDEEVKRADSDKNHEAGELTAL